MHSFSMFFVDDRRFSAASLSLLFLSLRSCRITWKHMNSASMCKRFFKEACPFSQARGACLKKRELSFVLARSFLLIVANYVLPYLIK